MTHGSPLQPFFEALLHRDASGRSWLPGLLAAVPSGGARLHDAVADPGPLAMSLSLRTASGRLGGFEQPVPPPPRLLRWYIDHPGRLQRPAGVEMPSGTARLRRALVEDDPPGSQARAQDRARELLATRISLSPEWWRFEDMTTPDFVLTTPRVTITVVSDQAPVLAPVSPWYPARSRLVRALEAAGQLAQDRTWGALVLADDPPAPDLEAHLEAHLEAAAPHLRPDERAELHAAYLGALDWNQACAAVGLDRSALAGARA